MGTRVTWMGGFEGPEGVEGWALLRRLREPRVVSRSRTTITESGILDLPAGPVAVHRKVYEYSGLRALLGGAFRTTFAAAGRARREADALERLHGLGLGPEPVALAERRAAGFLLEALIAARTVEGGRPLDALPLERPLAEAAGRAAGRLHAAGLVDLDLAPRNLVCAPRDGGWTVLKVDSGRLRPGGPGDAARAADLADLLAGLEGRADRDALAALRGAYAAEAGGLPAGLGEEMAAARGRAMRRYASFSRRP